MGWREGWNIHDLHSIDIKKLFVLSISLFSHKLQPCVRIRYLEHANNLTKNIFAVLPKTVAPCKLNLSVKHFSFIIYILLYFKRCLQFTMLTLRRYPKYRDYI